MTQVVEGLRSKLEDLSSSLSTAKKTSKNPQSKGLDCQPLLTNQKICQC
jgi:hypothetical protein